MCSDQSASGACEQREEARALDHDVLEHGMLEVLVLTRFWAFQCGAALGYTLARFQCAGALSRASHVGVRL